MSIENQQPKRVPMTIETWATELRQQWKQFCEEIKEFSSFIKNTEHLEREDVWEEIANAMLAYRHAEDAVMRLGKVIQAYHGWENIYDKK